MRPADWKPLLVFAGIFAALVVAFKAAATLERTVGRATGNFGYTPDPEGTRAFLSDLDHPQFRQAGPECMAATPKDTFLWRAAHDASMIVYKKPFAPWNQGNAGTCVSFGWGMGSWIGQCNAWKCGELAEPPKMVATEPLYAGSRTFARMPPVTFAGYGDGSYGAAAARWVSGQCKDKTVGGILYREVYGKYDLRSYSIPLSKEWGAYGPPREIAVEAHKHLAVSVAQVKTWDELVAAIGSGYPVPICSNVGFAATNVRDKDGFLPRGGSWGHCMVVVGTRFANGEGKRDGVCVLNSWGSLWCSGPKWPADQPDGSFWCSRKDIESILSQGDSFAIGSVDGFKYRNLDNGGWMNPAPTDVKGE